MRPPLRFAVQRGTALLVSLLVLLVLALLAATVARTSLLQMQMAGNDEHRMSARQWALAAVDGVLASGIGLELSAKPGFTRCTVGSTAPGCDASDIQLVPAVKPATGRQEAAVARVAPLVSRLPRLSEESASSTVFYRAARFEIRGTYDGTAEGLGRAAVVQGVLVKMDY